MRNINLLLPFLFLLFSCSNKTDDVLRVGVTSWAPNEFFFLADYQGYYNDKNIELVSYRTPSEAIRAYETEMVDAVLLTNHLFLQMNATEPSSKNKIIMVIDFSSGNDVLLANPKIKTISELKGKKIGAEANALGVYVMLRFLEINGISSDTINYVPIDVANHLQAFEMGDFDAVITYEPFATEIVNEGAKKLFDSKAIPYEITDILVTTSKNISKKEEALTNLCEGFFRAYNDFQNNQQKYAPLLAHREDLTSDEFLSTLNGVTVLDLVDNRSLLRNPESQFYQTFELTNSKMMEYGFIEKRQKINQLTDFSIIERIHDENK